MAHAMNLLVVLVTFSSDQNDIVLLGELDRVFDRSPTVDLADVSLSGSADHADLHLVEDITKAGDMVVVRVRGDD